ncbi:RAMP superfamily CRISPR-associated protein [Clostridium sp. Cult1]|uniref:RAMP superfamily CRISPR-associated protein n=1 Tax=Clostridium sp. Cult1 TaxID=2079002 RepID=UPI001F197839|nr:RAMP superfamily CRISPR-associated protein [Clostridium sp. Cult1]MCF6463751.1 hypothetical protein [Clostridium sp. Cult1]
MVEIISVLKATIVSKSPLFIGDNQENPLLDDDGQRAYLPATSVAGAFRSYLKNVGMDYEKSFGSQKEDKSSMSKVYVKDSFAPIIRFDRRDGVKIDSQYGSHVDGQKIERNFIGQGLEFELMFEIHSKDDEIEELKNMIYTCLKALDEGIVRLGGNKSNGLGIFKIKEAKEIDFHLLKNLDDLIRYLNKDYSNTVDVKKTIDNIQLPKNYVEFSIEGKFSTPLMIKAPKTFDSMDVDDRSVQVEGQYMVPGSSFKGALRARVEKIANLFDSLEEAKAIFGDVEEKNEEDSDRKKELSRVLVKESVIDTSSFEEPIYHRIKIDRFTGGVMTGSLMNDIPTKGEIRFNITYRKKGDKHFDKYAVGLLALALRDLGTENLSLGGGSSIGRGRFKGDTMYIDDGEDIIEIDFNKKTISNEKKLNSYIEGVRKFKGKGETDEK